MKILLRKDIQDLILRINAIGNLCGEEIEGITTTKKSKEPIPILNSNMKIEKSVSISNQTPISQHKDPSLHKKKLLARKESKR